MTPGSTCVSGQLIINSLRYGAKLPARYLSSMCLVNGERVHARWFVTAFSRYICAAKVIYGTLGREIHEYLLSPCGRVATEDLEMMEIEERLEQEGEGDLRSARAELRSQRNELIARVTAQRDLSRRELLDRYRAVPYADGVGLRDLCGERDPLRNQLICRLPTSVLRELCIEPLPERAEHGVRGIGRGETEE